VTGPAAAAPLDGKSYIIELSSSQYSGGYGEYLVPPLVKALRKERLQQTTGTEADIVVNVLTASDVGQWMNTAEGRAWLYTVSVTVGVSPGTYTIPQDGTPAFGVRAELVTPNPDREDELSCLIGLAARTAIRNYPAEGVFTTDGQSCLRK
jgi:hypothetical protein